MDQLFDLIGSPFVEKPPRVFSDQELLAAYELAFPNRVALLYLSLHRREVWAAELEGKYQKLKAREQMTFEVIARLGQVLNEWSVDDYVIFKSIKPYPATPNDTDVICFADSEGYEDMYRELLKAGYVFHEWAPQQRTVYDPRGAGKIGAGKKGGTYYVDLYTEISTDYFSYMDKRRLKPFVVTREVNGVSVKLLRPEPELAIVMFHSVFPERTFQLEHFYMPLYTLATPNFDLAVFVQFCRDSRLIHAVKTQVSLIGWMHEKHFGFVPEPVQRILAELGDNQREVARFAAREGRTPYMFSPRTFWSAFACKAFEWHSFKSLMRQGFRMLNPRFFIDVVRSIRIRLSNEGIYHLEA